MIQRFIQDSIITGHCPTGHVLIFLKERTMKTVNDKTGLRESAKLFAEAMAEKYINKDDTKNGIFMIVSEDGGCSSAVIGNGNVLTNDLANSMLQDNDIDVIVNSAFIGVHGKMFYELIKTKIKNNEDLPLFEN